MKSFVDIVSVYSSNHDRNIDELLALYNDERALFDTVNNVLRKNLSLNDISGKRILFKPNWVTHNQKPDDPICLCTHEKFIIAALKSILLLQPKSVLIADAPINLCDWDRLLSAEFLSSVDKLSLKYGIPITIQDFRRATFSREKNEVIENVRPIEDYIIFDVGENSYLEPITSSTNSFRITNYDSARLARSHYRGVHKYCIAKEFFDSDVVITLPKIKTHQKSGLTNALKILVGINGDKDMLPHHRIGAIGHGGDCYKTWHPLRWLAEHILDFANTRRGKSGYKLLMFVVAVLWKLSCPNKETGLAAGWYGNDTVWRMVMDINKVARYGKSDGTIADTPQRVVYSLCDGIIGGQGNGPLSPIPCPLGIIAFSNDSNLVDEAVGRIMSLDIEKIPLLNEAMKQNTQTEGEVYLNGKLITMKDLSKIAVDVLMPPGWENYNKE